MTAVHQVAAVVVRLLLVSVIAFMLLQLIPGDPAITLAGENASAERVEEFRELLGLNDPLPLQYWNWLLSVLTGDFGNSIPTGQPVLKLILARVPVTLSLGGLAILIAAITGITMGIIAAVRRGRLIDRALTLLASLGVAIPPFWLGLILIIIFSLNLAWLPSIGYVSLSEDPLGWARHLLLPAIALAAAPAAEIARQMRAAMIDVLDQDYVRTARAKGMSARSTTLKHALKNAMIPVVTTIGLQVSLLLGGTVVVETIFGIPGMGGLVIQSVLQRDIPVVQGVVMFAAVMVLLANALVDLSYRYFNPKVRVA